jgi:Flp pilus assembly protein TadD
MFDDSIAALERAVRLEPKEWLYRNNIAMVLVERGRVEEAVSHLQAVRGEAVACYNVAYILQKKGDLEAAKALFARALLKDPSMTNASIWLQRLDEQLASRGRSTPRMAADARRARRPAEAPGPSQRAADFTGRPTPAPVPPRTSIPGAIGGGSSQGGIPVVQPLPPVR